MYPRALFATALLVALPVVSASASDDSRDGAKDGGGRATQGAVAGGGGRAASGAAAGTVALEGVQEKTAETPATDSNAASNAETHVTGDNLQTARKPDESPFSEIKILPSF